MCELHQNTKYRCYGKLVLDSWTLLLSLACMGVLALAGWGFSLIPKHILKAEWFIKAMVYTMLAVVIFLFWQSGQKAKSAERKEPGDEADN